MTVNCRLISMVNPGRHIWGLSAVILASILCLSGCGLPEYAEISKPVPITDSGFSSAVLGFRTPADTTDITGYVLFYKIYTSNSDFNATDASNKSDVDYFDENSYISSNVDMPPGDVIPFQRGFIRIGDPNVVGTPSDNNFQISSAALSIPGTEVYIDFDYPQPGDVATDFPNGQGFADRGSAPPTLMIGSYDPVDVLTELARGITDPDFTGSISYLSFVDDYDYENSDTDGHNDADLHRKLNVTPSTNITTLISSLNTGTALVDYTPPISPLVNGEIQIGVAVYSVGVDPATLQLITSKPVLLGRVRYTELRDIDRDR